MLLQVSRTGTLCDGSDDERARFRDSFDRRHWGLFPQFIAPSLLADLDRFLGSATASEIDHGVGHELQVQSTRATALLSFIANDRTLFDAIEQLTGCAHIGCFSGRIYEMRRDGQHEFHWHTDLIQDRMIAMSVNLSAGPYEGGLLQIADAESREILQTVANLGRGDAVIFRLAPSLMHRVTPVQGEVPKIAFAGWYRSKPSYLDLLTEQPEA